MALENSQVFADVEMHGGDGATGKRDPQRVGRNENDQRTYKQNILPV